MSAEPLLHFAQLDENNVVIDVALVTQEFIDENPDRYPGTWVETWQNVEGVIFAGVGSEYDPATKTFTHWHPAVKVLTEEEKELLRQNPPS
jgi:hypothetical protein